MKIITGLRTAVLTVLLTMGLSFYVDIRDHEVHARDLRIRSALEHALRAEAELSNMLLIAALERNILRARKYDETSAELEASVNAVAELHLDRRYVPEVSDLLLRHDELRKTETAVIELMRQGQWAQARAALLDADYVRRASMHEIDLETTVGAMTGELVAQSERFDLLRLLALLLRAASVIMLLWVGYLYSRQLRAEVRLQTRIQADLSASQQALRDLAAHEETLREALRKQISQEIHDDLGQRLTVLRMDVAMLPRVVQADPAKLLPREVDGLKQSIDGIVAVVREIAGRLRPAALEVGLGAAAESLLYEFHLAMNIPCVLRDSLPVGLELDEVHRTTVYRILQEAMTNVARHAGASRVEVELSLSNRELSLSVADDGRGFSGTRTGGYGVSGMRERAQSLGGRLWISSAPGEGTTVQAWIPLDAQLSPAMTPALPGQTARAD